MTHSLPADDVPDLQGVLVHGYGHLEAACFVLLSVDPAHARDARNFLAGVEPTNVLAARAAKKSRDHDAHRRSFVNVAFTHAGLGALGLDDALLDAFPREFVEGSTTEARARMLGDVEASHPSRWKWGGPNTDPIHVAMMLYATPASIDEHRRSTLAGANAAGLKEVVTLDTIRLPRRQEHFGFRDGIAQPAIRGAGDPGTNPDGKIAPGEILLGHPDEFGETSHVPAGRRFARNGSYMVLRQLEQDVAGFWKFCRSHSTSDSGAIHLAAKMVGRWPSGAPIVKYPDSDPGDVAQDDDDFLYASGPTRDPAGRRCPFGSHVRRSNPRDGLLEDPQDSLRVASRHRLIRRGRAYGAPLCPDAEPSSYLEALERGTSEGSDRGLHFVCFNASLERQFEFVQQQWCENPKLAGAANGSDPLIGSQRPLPSGTPAFTIPAPEGEPSRRVAGLRRFVEVRGGAYLFLPAVSAVRSLAED